MLQLDFAAITFHSNAQTIQSTMTCIRALFELSLSKHLNI